ncbi:unnamed protein product [Bursaphelenchus okinawaensis]|uniref:Uncharacterized protein n=1 Tax=Bursaphelenchus okinawaensis TaxID=465554 RepID=A0A811KEB2_9BILA|nr:unnamed protein product [Bursaphelenchus okinawaensis]CAG9102217.1 unnamed protein product [Bursaphelenchus okinawaensis]
MISRFRPETALYKEYFALVGKADARAKRKTQKGGTPKGGAKSPMSRRRSSEKPKSTGLAQKGGPKIKRSSSPHA